MFVGWKNSCFLAAGRGTNNLSAAFERYVARSAQAGRAQAIIARSRRARHLRATPGARSVTSARWLMVALTGVR